jgi:hypothetical protein
VSHGRHNSAHGGGWGSRGKRLRSKLGDSITLGRLTDLLGAAGRRQKGGAMERDVEKEQDKDQQEQGGDEQQQETPPASETEQTA